MTPKNCQAQPQVSRRKFGWAGAMTNYLAGEASPYLRKHGHDGINWRTWGEEAFAFARSAGQPVLVSIGYLACYWCHVMARETYGDPSVIAAINRDFVAIKVDREERPDVDRSVLDAMAALGARTGWPVTAFMTPDGEVFAGGSYFPPEPRHGLPGFIAVPRRRPRRVSRRSCARGKGAKNAKIRADADQCCHRHRGLFKISW